MAAGLSKITRAVLGLPFLGLAVLCILAMDLEKLLAHQQPFLESGKIEYDGGSIPILEHFHYFKFLDDLWRGATATFSPATLGYDSISSWQMFSFLHDLGPVYAVWYLESYRAANHFTPAYFPTVFTFAGQLLGIGFVAPVMCFITFVFGPSPSEIARSGRGREIRTGDIPFLLPTILTLYTAEVFAAFCSSTPESRHYWAWAWQMAPLEVGVLNFIVARLSLALLSDRATARTGGISPAAFLAVLGSISSAVWVYMLLSAPHPLSEIFVPDTGTDTSNFVLHTRWAVQVDEMFAFAGCFLWLVYSLLDLRVAGILGKQTIIPFAVFPIVVACLGPGSAFALGWYWRETLIEAGKTKGSKW